MVSDVDFERLLSFELSWPELGDQLLPARSPQGDGAGTLGGWSRNTLMFSASFKSAADHLVEAVVNGAAREDHVSWPILYLYRHAVELSFKFALQCGQQALGEQDLSLTGHDFAKFLREMRRQIPLLDLEDDDAFHAFSNMVMELASVDPNGEVFRYPFNKNGTRFQLGFDNPDLVKLRKGIEKLLRYLDAYADAASALIP